MVVVAESCPIDKKLCKNQENLKLGVNLIFPLSFCTGQWNSLKARGFKNKSFPKYFSLELMKTISLKDLKDTENLVCASTGFVNALNI